ncbi:glycosyltransferase [Pedobacter sp. AW1-32]|uniref:glycosyltransferase n=1 Tax=Pedobacter sp. AW1-32 TaxID=3383026 RepID=UPI003FEEDFE4
MKENWLLTILMATYNGAQFLEKQLQSICSQTYTHWELIIRDDGSDDETLHIIEHFAQKDKRISRIEYGNLHGTPCRNFSQLFDWAYENQRETILFADQDDIWLPNKLECSLNGLVKNEIILGTKTPILCYSKLSFIDEDDRKIDAEIPLPQTLKLNVLLHENYAWGCTIIINAAAVQKIKHIPTESVNHDYYVALVCAAFGKNVLLNENLILYRQHGKNVSGNVDKMSFTARFQRYLGQSDTMLKPLIANYSLVQTFYERYETDPAFAEKQIVAGFLKKYQSGFLPLALYMLKHKLMKIGIGKNMVYFYTLFLLRKKVVQAVETGGRV